MWEGLTLKFDKNTLTYSVSYFNLGGLGTVFGGAKPSKLSRGDGTGLKASWIFAKGEHFAN